MIYALTDAEGRALGFFADWHEGIPDAAFPIEEATHEAWIQDTARQRWNGTGLEPCELPQVPGFRRITPLAFRRRLPMVKRHAITLAASAAMEQGDATLQTFLDDLAAARYVDLDDPEVVAGVAALQAAGLLTPDQAAALLADGTKDEAR